VDLPGPQGERLYDYLPPEHGEVEIGEAVYCGTGAKIINQLTIGESTIIGAGAVVAKSLPSNCTAVGVPAKIVKINN
jgi:acetyltransferase-like isoleucine patch superfamily enzyme